MSWGKDSTLYWVPVRLTGNRKNRKNFMSGTMSVFRHNVHRAGREKQANTTLKHHRKSSTSMSSMSRTMKIASIFDTMCTERNALASSVRFSFENQANTTLKHHRKSSTSMSGMSRTMKIALVPDIKFFAKLRTSSMPRGVQFFAAPH